MEGPGQGYPPSLNMGESSPSLRIESLLYLPVTEFYGKFLLFFFDGRSRASFRVAEVLLEVPDLFPIPVSE